MIVSEPERDTLYGRGSLTRQQADSQTLAFRHVRLLDADRVGQPLQQRAEPRQLRVVDDTSGTAWRERTDEQIEAAIVLVDRDAQPPIEQMRGGSARDRVA